MLNRGIAFAFVVLAALPSTMRAQSCAAADGAIGATKKHDQMKVKYDKFADTTTLETKDQPFMFLFRANIKLSFVAKHAGEADGPLVTQLHLNAWRTLDHHSSVASTPDIFPDSTQAIVVTDSGRMVLRGAGHRATRMQDNPLVGPTIEEDLWFPVTAAELAQLALTKKGGIRIGEFDMPMQGKISETAALAYRTVVCAPPLATASTAK